MTNEERAIETAEAQARAAINKLAHEDAHEQAEEAAELAYANNHDQAYDFYMSEEYDSLFDKFYAEAMSDQCQESQ